MKDFSLDIYRILLETLQAKGYELIPYGEYCRESKVESRKTAALKEESRKSKDKFVILRHDVDAKPENSLRTAQIEHALGAKATYYFRKPTSNFLYLDGHWQSSTLKGRGVSMTEPEIIRSIAQLGHEIGYHYEDMSLCGGDIDAAWSHFRTWLDYFRRYYAVETICMHGAPTSQWDSKDLWRKYDYRSLGIIGEPYLDTNFGDVFYLTDTGRCWDGYRVSVRDKIPAYQDEWTAEGLTWHTTPELIEAIKTDRTPRHMMMTTHPQRWTNNSKDRFRELVLQTIKNCIKRLWIRN